MSEINEMVTVVNEVQFKNAPHKSVFELQIAKDATIESLAELHKAFLTLAARRLYKPATVPANQVWTAESLTKALTESMSQAVEKWFTRAAEDFRGSNKGKLYLKKHEINKDLDSEEVQAEKKARTSKWNAYGIRSQFQEAIATPEDERTNNQKIVIALVTPHLPAEQDGEDLLDSIED